MEWTKYLIPTSLHFFLTSHFFFSKQYTLAVHRNVYIRESCFNYKLEMIFNIVNSKVNICTYTVIWFPLLMKVNCTKTREITALKSASHLQETINYLKCCTALLVRERFTSPIYLHWPTSNTCMLVFWTHITTILKTLFQNEDLERKHHCSYRKFLCHIYYFD